MGTSAPGRPPAINEVLAEADRPIAVIVNDVGAINIDAKLIKKRNATRWSSPTGASVAPRSRGLGRRSIRIRSRAEPPAHILVELSGVAEPANVVPWGSSAGFMLDGVVVVAAVDQVIDDAMPAWIRTHLDRQLTEADSSC